MSKHTPGPWRRNVIMTTQGGKSEHVAIESMHDPKFPRGYMLARVYKERDASLIAAAPELYLFLCELKSYLYNAFEPDNQSSRYYELVTLLNKIEGNHES